MVGKKTTGVKRKAMGKNKGGGKGTDGGQEEGGEAGMKMQKPRSKVPRRPRKVQNEC